MIEFELCIGLIFKPLRHHMKAVLQFGNIGGLASVWESVLSVLEDLLSDEKRSQSVDDKRIGLPDSIKSTMDNLANEHLQNAISILLGAGVIFPDAKTPGDISSITWDAVKRMGIADKAVAEWKKSAS